MPDPELGESCAESLNPTLSPQQAPGQQPPGLVTPGPSEPGGDEPSPKEPLPRTDFLTITTRKRLLLLARRLGARDPTEAADVVDEAMTEVLVKGEEINNPFGYARVVIRNGLAKKRKRDGEKRARDLGAKGEWTPDHKQDDELSAVVDIEWVLHMLSSLPKSQRRVMALYFDGFTQKEIAERLGLKPSNVRATLHNARRTLKNRSEIQGLHRRNTHALKGAGPPRSGSKRAPDPAAVPGVVPKGVTR